MRPGGDQLEAGTHILVSLEWAGQVFRLADDEVDVPSDDGDIHFGGTVSDVVVPQMVNPLDAQGAAQSFTVEAVLPVSVPDLIASGYDLASARCEVSRWCVGTDFEDREILMIGNVTDPESGAEWDPVRFSVSSDVWDDESLGPMAEDAIVTGANFTYITTLFASWLGLPYPEIFGRPGFVDTSIYSTGVITGSGALWIWSDPTADPGGAGPATTNAIKMAVLLAGHHVGVTEVLMNTDTDPDGKRFKITNTYDLVGRPIAIVNWYHTAGSTPADVFAYDVTVVYSWSSGSVYGLGHASLDVTYGADQIQGQLSVGWRDQTDATLGGRMDIRDAGDVLEYMLGKTHIPVDYGRMAAAKPFLAGFKIDAVVDAFVNPWTWVRDNLLPILPVSVARGGNGLYVIPWRWSAEAADAILRLDADVDPGVIRASGVKSSTAKIRNQFSLDFAYSWRNKSRVGRVELGAWDYDTAAPMRGVSPLCAASQRLLRNPDGTPRVLKEELSTTVIYDLATAHLILRTRADAYAMPWTSVRYEVPRPLGYAEAGAVVIVNDTEAGLVERVALVTGRQVSARSVVYSLLIQPRPGRELYS